MIAWSESRMASGSPATGGVVDLSALEGHASW